MSDKEPERCLFFGDGKGDLAAAKQAGVTFVAIDPRTGEFAGEQGFSGPYRDLAERGDKAVITFGIYRCGRDSRRESICPKSVIHVSGMNPFV